MVKYHCSFRKNVLMANYGKAFLITMARKMFTLEFEKDLDFIVWKNTCIFPALCRCWSKTGWGAFQEMFGHHCDGVFFCSTFIFYINDLNLSKRKHWGVWRNWQWPFSPDKEPITHFFHLNIDVNLGTHNNFFFFYPLCTVGAGLHQLASVEEVGILSCVMLVWNHVMRRTDPTQFAIGQWHRRGGTQKTASHDEDGGKGGAMSETQWSISGKSRGRKKFCLSFLFIGFSCRRQLHKQQQPVFFVHVCGPLTLLRVWRIQSVWKNPAACNPSCMARH